MKKLRVIVIASLLSLLAENAAHALIYTVRPNDTLWDIAGRYGSDVRTIIRINDLVDENLSPGQTLAVPEKVVEYVVCSGDNLIRIASRLGSGVGYIIVYNNLPHETLYVGQKLLVPVVSSQTQSAPAEPEVRPITYEVSRGDTLGAIALRYGVSVQQIMEWNRKQTDSIYAGENLRIYPARDSQEVTPPETTTSTTVVVSVTTTTVPARRQAVYEVRSGDTLIGIAARFGVSVDRVMEWNRKTAQTVYIGEKLTVYPAEGFPVAGNLITHVVAGGETLNRIAIRYGVSVNEILNWNHKTSDTIYAGEKLKIYADESVDVDSPVAVQETPPSVLPVTYTVARGDTMTSIASKYGVGIDEIRRWNRIERDALFAGQRLTIYPRSTVQPVRPANVLSGPPGTVRIQYSVMDGDTIGLIASRYGVDKDQIESWNGRNGDTIYVGEKLTLFVAPGLVNSGSAGNLKWGDFKLYPVKRDRIHDVEVTARGVRVTLDRATDVYSMQDGKVEYAGLLDGFRYVVIVRHSDNRLVVYGYLNSVQISTGQSVCAGQCIGKVDYFSLYGKISLYLELREAGNFVNALSALPFIGNLTRSDAEN